MRYILLYALVLLPCPLVAQTPADKAATIKWLSALQLPDGGFLPAPQDPRVDAVPRSSLRATSGAIRAIKYLGGDAPHKDKALAFVKSCYSAENGAFADVPGGKEEVSTTAIGMMAMKALEEHPMLDKSIAYLAAKAKTFEERRLAVAGMEAAGKFAPEVKEWLAEVAKSRNADGTYGQAAGRARDTGGVAAMFLRSGADLSADHRKAILEALLAGQRSDGGFGKADSTASDPETTYRVMRAFHWLKEKPKDIAKLREFLGKCRNADGGYGVAPGQTSSVSGTYYAAVIGYWLDQ
jgi:hypothetical protein